MFYYNSVCVQVSQKKTTVCIIPVDSIIKVYQNRIIHCVCVYVCVYICTVYVYIYDHVRVLVCLCDLCVCTMSTPNVRVCNTNDFYSNYA